MSLTIPLRLKGKVNIWDLTREAIRRALDRATDRITRELKHLTPIGPYGKGTLRSSFYADIRGDTIRLIWPEDYAEVVDKGARGHMILPKTKQALSFPDRSGKQFGTRKDYDGRAVVKYVLRHPGQAAQHFGMRTARAAYAIIRDEIINEIARIEM